MTETTTRSSLFYTSDVDTAIEVFFSTLMDIASDHGVDPEAVMEAAERRGCGADGFETWLEDDE